MPGGVWAFLGGAAALLAGAAVVVRVWLLQGRPGAFECAVREVHRKGWASGIAVFAGDRLLWYRVFSLSLRPARSWPRSRLHVLERHRRLLLGRRTNVVEMTCSVGDGELVLAMRDKVAAGVVSWIEAAPPAGLTWAEPGEGE